MSRILHSGGAVVVVVVMMMVAVSWAAAFTEIGAILRGLDSPNRAEFALRRRSTDDRENQ